GVAVVAVRAAEEPAARAALSRAGLAELRLPGRYAGLSLADAARTMDERRRVVPEERQGVEEELSRLRAEHLDAVNHLRLELRDELGRYAAVEAAGKGRYGFALRGWLPKDSRPALEAALRPMASQLVYEFAEPDPHHPGPVPVTLKNNAFVRPFELLLGIFAPPGYGSFDPTWVIATFFPIFFGFVIGDVGFGALFLVLAYWMRGMARSGKTFNISFMSMRVPPAVERPLSTILTHMGVWSVIFGFIYGELFGTLGEHLHLFRTGHEEGLIPTLLPRLDTAGTAGTMMLLALAPGIIQVLYGWYVRFSLGLKHGDRRHVFEGLGMFVGLAGLVVISYAYRNPGSPGWLYTIGIACLVVFAVCVFLSGVFMMFIEILSNGGNILSYLRLYAVGLSSAVLAQLATDLGWSLGAKLGVLGILIGIVVALLVHVLAITFTIIGHVLQPLRLHYAEFFTKFGFFESSGRPYRPFARLGGHEVAGQ
ncbi:MAG TPA: V-type ATPase 116kDa subunit family protein, partial [Deinococcales bacterium]|nr:V-type ATPase 116kDa subunit family protein [Deinococcales bacterium]